MNEKFEEYLKDLSPELQEKARQCKTKEELDAFLAENDLEMPEEVLELVAGGVCTSTPPAPDKCNKCNAKVTQCTHEDSDAVHAYNHKRWGDLGLTRYVIYYNDYYRCPNCGIVFKDEIHA